MTHQQLSDFSISFHGDFVLNSFRIYGMMNRICLLEAIHFECWKSFRTQVNFKV